MLEDISNFLDGSQAKDGVGNILADPTTKQICGSESLAGGVRFRPSNGCYCSKCSSKTAVKSEGEGAA